MIGIMIVAATSLLAGIFFGCYIGMPLETGRVFGFWAGLVWLLAVFEMLAIQLASDRKSMEQKGYNPPPKNAKRPERPMPAPPRSPSVTKGGRIT